MKRVVTGIFDTLCTKYNNSFKMTKENFEEAKNELLETIRTAITGARNETTLRTYREMMEDAKKIQNWPKFQFFLWNEKLAREGLKKIAD